MRRGILCCLVVAFSPALAHAELRFTATSVDLGQIRGGQPLTHRFSFTNTAAEEIEIVEVRPGCGCLAPRLSKNRLAPGETGSLEFALRTLGQAAGPHTWTARVHYRVGSKLNELPLRITADIINDILLQPASLSLIARGPMSQEVTLTDTRARPLQVTGVHTSSKFLKARITKQEKSSAGHWQVKIALEVAEDCPPGSHSESMSIYTADAEYRQLVIPVAISRISTATISAHPNELELVPGNGVVSKFVRLETTRAEPVVIEQVTADHRAITCTWARGPGNAATVRVNVQASQIEGALETTVRVEIASPRRETVVIPVRCQ